MATVKHSSTRMKQFIKAFPECIFPPPPTEKRSRATKKSKHPPKAQESDGDAFGDEEIEIADDIGDAGVDDADESDGVNFGRRLASPVQAQSDDEESENTVASESDDNRAHGSRKGAGSNQRAPTRQLSNKAQPIPKKNTSLSSPPGRGNKTRGFSLSSCFDFCLLFRPFISS